jgi:hypothetical protein
VDISESKEQTVAFHERDVAETGKIAADELVRAIYETLAISDEQLAARPKLVSLALASEAASRNSRAIFTMSNLALGGLTGLPEKVISQIMQDLPARNGTPFERIVTREYVEVAPGIKEPRSIAQVRITTAEVGKRIAWGWCSTHESTEVNVKGHCSACSEVVGERMMTANEFSLTRLSASLRRSEIAARG